ncbi:MAG: WXG100 family type VII secretion target [Anaerolineae bacterium]|nr:WXG100 family type VII secretion target [Anaerolineae bacterium]
MLAYKVQADYDELADIMRRFDTEGQDVERLKRRIQFLVEDLERRGWRGRGARAFYSEMYMDVLPALRALYDALYAASDATRQISDMIERAEEEASELFGG